MYVCSVNYVTETTGDSLFITTACVLIYLPIALFAYTSGSDVVAVILLLILYCIILYPDVKKPFLFNFISIVRA
jgi:hypothetical protein